MHLHLTGQIFFEFLKHYGYWVMLPLMIVEGPVVTLFAAIMASLGAFNVWIVLVFSILGDLIGDAIFYGLAIALEWICKLRGKTYGHYA